ncbi:MAG: STAS/SEC14 domain-containing protein [Candidatus Competibacteraceae bacterium]|nr:MAG: STAS/SEC14 domain-containing protein [Candidatus Competibacteraceae bacterium]
MTISSQKIADRVYWITLSGLLTWAEFQNFLVQAETEKVFATGKIKFLLLLDEFTGWEPGEEWGDVSFFFKHDPDIEKIAVVGESCWRDDMQMFLFADYRQAEVKFFAETDLETARVWLMS